MLVHNIVKKTVLAKQKIKDSLGLPFKEHLSEGMVIDCLKELGLKFRDRVYTPYVTLLIYLSQVMDQDQSCRKAVSRLISHFVQNALEPPSSDTGAYCKARQRLSLELLAMLIKKICSSLKSKVNSEHKWFGRTVKIIDGSTVSMPDTEKNQQEFPQHKKQAKGCGFPLAYIGALFCHATGAMLEISFGNKHTGEKELLRMIWHTLKTGEILLADGYYPTYFIISSLLKGDVDILMRQHHKRKVDFKKGIALGKNDHLITFTIPYMKSIRNITQKEYEELPLSLTLREVKFVIRRKGWRDTEMILVTSLTCPKKYPLEKIAELYTQRWRCEVNFRDLKTTMKMDITTGRTPEMMKKEVYIRMLAYNIMRTIMWDSARPDKQDYLRISFKGALQHFTNFMIYISFQTKNQFETSKKIMAQLIAKELNPDRPFRVEPRVQKRRPKLFKLMIKPRNELKNVLRSA